MGLSILLHQAVLTFPSRAGAASLDGGLPRAPSRPHDPVLQRNPVPVVDPAPGPRRIRPSSPHPVPPALIPLVPVIHPGSSLSFGADVSSGAFCPHEFAPPSRRLRTLFTMMGRPWQFEVFGQGFRGLWTWNCDPKESWIKEGVSCLHRGVRLYRLFG